MLYEFKQVNVGGNGSTTTCFIVKNPRIENGMYVADIVGTFHSFSKENQGEYIYKSCEPKKLVVGGNFTMVEYTRDLVSEDSISR